MFTQHECSKLLVLCYRRCKLFVKGKVFYGQEPPGGESTTTEFGFNYQLLAVIYWNRSQPQPATDNGIRVGSSNWLVAPSTLHRAVSPDLHVLHTAMRAGLQITRVTALREPRSCDLRNARPMHCLCGHSGYKITFASLILKYCLINKITICYVICCM